MTSFVKEYCMLCCRFLRQNVNLSHSCTGACVMCTKYGCVFNTENRCLHIKHKSMNKHKEHSTKVDAAVMSCGSSSFYYFTDCHATLAQAYCRKLLKYNLTAAQLTQSISGTMITMLSQHSAYSSPEMQNKTAIHCFLAMFENSA